MHFAVRFARMQDDEVLIRLLRLSRFGQQLPMEMLKSLLPHLTLRALVKGEVRSAGTPAAQRRRGPRHDGLAGLEHKVARVCAGHAGPVRTSAGVAVCVYVCICVIARARAGVCMRACACVRARVCVCVCIHINVHVCTYACYVSTPAPVRAVAPVCGGLGCD